MKICYFPEKNPLGKSYFYYLGRVRLTEGVSDVSEAVKKHPDYQLFLDSGAVKILDEVIPQTEIKPIPQPILELDPPKRGRKPKLED